VNVMQFRVAPHRDMSIFIAIVSCTYLEGSKPEPKRGLGLLLHADAAGGSGAGASVLGAGGPRGRGGIVGVGGVQRGRGCALRVSE
jgi:hypothetical protein